MCQFPEIEKLPYFPFRVSTEVGRKRPTITAKGAKTKASKQYIQQSIPRQAALNGDLRSKFSYGEFDPHSG